MAEPALDDLSMEEILSSIRRIITHDEAEAQKRNASDSTAERSDADQGKRSASSPSAPTQSSAAPETQAPSSARTQTPQAQASPAQAPSAPAAHESSASAARASPLSERLREVERQFHPRRRVLEGIEGGIEAYAESVLRPLLAQWLKENLPALLDRIMREEVERAVQRLRK